MALATTPATMDDARETTSTRQSRLDKLCAPPPVDFKPWVPIANQRCVRFHRRWRTLVKTMAEISSQIDATVLAVVIRPETGALYPFATPDVASLARDERLIHLLRQALRHDERYTLQTMSAASVPATKTERLAQAREAAARRRQRRQQQQQQQQQRRKQQQQQQQQRPRRRQPRSPSPAPMSDDSDYEDDSDDGIVVVDDNDDDDDGDYTDRTDPASSSSPSTPSSDENSDAWDECPSLGGGEPVSPSPSSSSSTESSSEEF